MQLVTHTKEFGLLVHLKCDFHSYPFVSFSSSLIKINLLYRRNATKEKEDMHRYDPHGTIKHSLSSFSHF